MENIQAALELACANFEVWLDTHIQLDVYIAPTYCLAELRPCHAPKSACMSSQVPSLRKQAEEEIQRFRHTPKPIRACQYILEHSASLGARFQAGYSFP